MSDTLTPRSTELSSSHVDTAATRGVLIELLEERRHQIDDHHWTPDHDDLHGAEDFAWLIGRRAILLSHRDAVAATEPAEVRRLLIEICAIGIAAIEALDRQDRR